MPESPVKKQYLPPVIRDICGTSRGVWAHRRADEEFCDPCREAKRADWKRWYDNNSERERERYKRNMLTLPGYKEKRKELHPAHSRKRRARKLDNGHEFYLEAQVLDTYGTDCHICGEPIDFDAPRQVGNGTGWQRGLHIDHLIPLAKGGPDTLENVRPSHALCNLQKHAKH